MIVWVCMGECVVEGIHLTSNILSRVCLLWVGANSVMRNCYIPTLGSTFRASADTLLLLPYTGKGAHPPLQTGALQHIASTEGQCGRPFLYCPTLARERISLARYLTLGLTRTSGSVTRSAGASPAHTGLPWPESTSLARLFLLAPSSKSSQPSASVHGNPPCTSKRVHLSC